jgi:enoyl-CoA hydratase/carnithine racemase
LATKVAQCGPLGIKTTLVSAHLAIDAGEDVAYEKLDERYGTLYRTEDFLEGRKAEAEGRSPVYHGR